jgi:hypothetical protein
MADGGEGTLDATLANGYERREAAVHGPLGAPLRASFAKGATRRSSSSPSPRGSRSSPRAAGMRWPRARGERAASDVHVQQSCLIIGFRSRWRVNPPPGEWEARPGDSETSLPSARCRHADRVAD